MKDQPWLYHGRPIADAELVGMAGFVYLIYAVGRGQLYIGRKYLTSTRRVAGKRRRITKESDWRGYWSSSDEVQRLHKDGEPLSRHILLLCRTRPQANYNETRLLFTYDVLNIRRNDGSYLFLNEAIAGKYWRGKPATIAAQE